MLLRTTILCAWVALALALSPCRKFECKDQVDPSNPEVCGKVVKKSASLWIEYVGKCDNGYMCSMSETDEAVKCIQSPSFYKYPGQRCTDPALCQGTVRDGFCRGKASGDACTSHLECDVGLRCGLDLKCEPAAVEGESCNDDEMLCQSYLYCKEKLCTRYGSVPDDVSPGKSGEDLCESHHVDKSGVCREGNTLIGSVIVDSNMDKCVYNDGEENQAVCGYHYDGKAICKPGDAELLSDWKALISYLDLKPQCHVMVGHMSQCDIAESVGRRAYIKGRLDYYKVHYYSQLQSVPECVKKFVYPEYFELESEYSSAGTVSAIVAALVALLVVLL